MHLSLFIVRHAHSFEKVGGQPDVQRELSVVGVQQATYVGQYLFDQNMNPDIIICSSATRAYTTAMLIAERLDISSDKIVQKQDLYNASVRNLLQMVNTLHVSWKQVILVAHNPSLHYFIDFITGDSLNALEPASLVELSFELGGWEFVSEKSGSLISYLPPFTK